MPVIPLLGIYSEKSIIEKDIHTLMFITPLLTTVKAWRQSKRLLMDEWIKMQYMYMMLQYSDIKKNDMMLFAATWMDLEIVMERSQTEKDKYHMISFIYRIKKEMIQMILFTKQKQTHRL